MMSFTLNAALLAFAVVGQTQLELPPGYRITGLTVQGNGSIFGMADSSGEKYLLKWDSHGRLLTKVSNASSSCCGWLTVSGRYIFISDPYSVYVALFDTGNLELVKEIYLKTGCAPSKMSIVYKRVFALDDSTLLVAGKYYHKQTKEFTLLSLWDTAGNFIKALVKEDQDSPWKKPQFFVTSLVDAGRTGDTITISNGMSFRVWVVSRDSVVKIARPVKEDWPVVGPPDQEAGDDYDAFGKWLYQQFKSPGKMVMGRCYSWGKYLVFNTHLGVSLAPDTFDWNRQAQLHIYDPTLNRVISSYPWDGAMIGFLTPDTMLLTRSGDLSTVFKAVVEK